MSLFRKLLLLSLFCLPICAQAQSSIAPSFNIAVTGLVKHEYVINPDSINRYPQTNIGDIVITNHLGEKKGVAKSLKGVSIKALLSNIGFAMESPKQLSELYLTFVASDGYKVVYSWNELFNSPTGDSTFVITEKEGKGIKEIPEGIIAITISDQKTGRRYVKGLAKIVVARTN